MPVTTTSTSCDMGMRSARGQKSRRYNCHLQVVTLAFQAGLKGSRGPCRQSPCGWGWALVFFWDPRRARRRPRASTCATGRFTYGMRSWRRAAATTARNSPSATCGRSPHWISAIRTSRPCARMTSTVSFASSLSICPTTCLLRFRGEYSMNCTYWRSFVWTETCWKDSRWASSINCSSSKTCASMTTALPRFPKACSRT